MDVRETIRTIMMSARIQMASSRARAMPSELGTIIWMGGTLWMP
jgi:hypothetical protein